MVCTVHKDITHKMSRAPLILLLTCNVIFMNETGLAAAQNECNVNADCRNQYKVCCEGYFHIRRKSCQLFSCLGRHCLTDGDCGGKGECCRSHQCVTFGCPECSSQSDCAASEYCCKHRNIHDHNVCRRSCVGETCHSSSDCAVGECCRSNKCVNYGCTECSSNSDCPTLEYCCMRGLSRNVCRRSCVGQTCLSNSGCGAPGQHCDSNFKCTTSTNSATLAGWAIGIIVSGAILLVIIIGGIWLYCRCNKPSQPGVVLQQSSQGIPATIALQNAQVQTRPPPELHAQLQYPKPTAPPYLPEPTAPPNLPEPTAPPLQVLNPPRIPNFNRGQNFLRSQLQDALSPQDLDFTSPQGLDFTSLQALDFTGMGELNLDCVM